MANNYHGMPGNHVGKTFDAFLELNAAGKELTTSQVVYLGTGLVDADIVLDVVEGTGTVVVQLSADEAFTTPVVLISINVENTGRMIVPFRNVAGNEEPYAYIRLVASTASKADEGDEAASSSSSLKAGAFIGKK